MTDAATEKKRSLSVICSKGSFDMAYPGLILANAARMAGVDARLFLGRRLLYAQFGHSARHSLRHTTKLVYLLKTRKQT